MNKSTRFNWFTCTVSNSVDVVYIIHACTHTIITMHLYGLQTSKSSITVLTVTQEVHNSTVNRRLLLQMKLLVSYMYLDPIS